MSTKYVNLEFIGVHILFCPKFWHKKGVKNPRFLACATQIATHLFAKNVNYRILLVMNEGLTSPAFEIHNQYGIIFKWQLN